MKENFEVKIKQLEDEIKRIDNILITIDKACLCLKEALDGFIEAQKSSLYPLRTRPKIFRYSHIEGALQQITFAKQYLNEIKDSLNPIEISSEDILDISGTLSFFDFINSFIADRMVQEKLNEAISKTETLHWQIREMLLSLKNNKLQKEDELAKYKQNLI